MIDSPTASTDVTVITPTASTDITSTASTVITPTAYTDVTRTVSSDITSSTLSDTMSVENTSTNSAKQAMRKQRQQNSLTLWHRRFAHLHSTALKKAIKSTTTPALFDSDGSKLCDICVRSKHQQKFARISIPRTTKPFELIHSDLCGPFTTHSLGGASYYIIYIDDCTRWTEIYLLIGKSGNEIRGKFLHYKAWVENQGYRIKRFRCDNGRGEFNNAGFFEILSESGITYEPAPPYTQHKNGTSERMIRTLNTKARSMLQDANLPARYWGEAIQTACYLHKRTPTATLPGFISPFEHLYGTAPKIHHLKRFGCAVYKHIPKDQRSDKNLGDRSRLCMMLGYVHQTTKIWRIWDFMTSRAVECSNALFNEEINANQKEMVTEDELLQLFPELEEEMIEEDMNEEDMNEEDMNEEDMNDDMNEDEVNEKEEEIQSEIGREVGKEVGNDKYYEGINPILLRWVVNPDVLYKV
jgi:hypothetical protein